MIKNNLRKRAKKNYYEPEERDLDEYIFCTECGDYVVEYCAVHGALLVIPDTEVSMDSTMSSLIPRAALTIPDVFLHIAPSIIPGAGLGVFTTLTLPPDVRFGPYTGDVKKDIGSPYCWQIYSRKRTPLHVIDAADPNRSNWMRYVNCSRHWNEQNLLAYQYRGEIYYRTLKIIPRNTELLVYYGTEYARELGIDIRGYNDPKKYANYITKTVVKDNVADTAGYFGEDVDEAPTDIFNEEQQKTQDEIIKINFENDTVTFEEVNNNQHNFQENISNYNIDNITKTTNEHNGSHLEQTDDPTIVNNDYLFNSESNFDENRLKIFEDNYINNTDDQYIHATVNLNGNETIQDREEYNNNPIYKLTENNYFQCQKCNIHSYSEAYLKKHIKLHDPNRLYECYICHYKYVHMRSLKRHLHDVHLETKKYQCILCKMIYSKLIYLNKHLTNDHNIIDSGNNKYVIIIDENEIVVPNKENLNLNSYDNQQNMILYDSKRYDEYMKIDNKQNIQKGCTQRNIFTGYKNTDDLYNKRTESITNENLDKTFSGKNIQNDQNYYTTDNLYAKCNICRYKTISIDHIKKHILLHDGRRPFSCHLCHFRFTDRKSVARHLNSVHKTEKNNCLSNFKTDLIIGRINSPKDTDIANAGDKCANDLKSVVISENNDAQENIKNEKTATEVLNKVETTINMSNIIEENNLKYSQNVDMSFQCYNCNVNTLSENAIKMHVGLHDSRRRHVCPICNYRFQAANKLKRHIKSVHCSDRP